jgi:hypothetical protein
LQNSGSSLHYKKYPCKRRNGQSYKIFKADSRISCKIIEKKRDEVKTKLETMTQDELAQVQELLQKITTAKHVQAKGVNS